MRITNFPCVHRWSQPRTRPYDNVSLSIQYFVVKPFALSSFVFSNNSVVRHLPKIIISHHSPNEVESPFPTSIPQPHRADSPAPESTPDPSPISAYEFTDLASPSRGKNSRWNLSYLIDLSCRGRTNTFNFSFPATAENEPRLMARFSVKGTDPERSIGLIPKSQGSGAPLANEC